MQVRLGLAGRLEVRLLADALPGELVRNSSCITSTSWSISTSGSSMVALATAYSMILSLNSWRARSSALRPRRSRDVGLERRHVRVVAHGLGEVVVGVGQDLLAQLLEVDLEVGRLAGERRLRVVLGERDVELGLVARLEADDVGLEARDEPVLAEDQRHPLGLAALERHPVLGAGEADHGPVAVLRRAVLDRGQLGVLVAQLLDDLVDLRARRSSRSRARS